MNPEFEIVEMNTSNDGDYEKQGKDSTNLKPNLVVEVDCVNSDDSNSSDSGSSGSESETDSGDIENPVEESEKVIKDIVDREDGGGDKTKERVKNYIIKFFLSSCNCFMFLYIFDWFIAFFIYIIFGWVIFDSLDPVEGFLPNNWVNQTQWSYPLEEETVSDTGLAMFVAMSFEFPTVTLIKVLASSYRPNYKELCDANPGGDCQEDIPNGAKSFPSGHSSAMFVIMTYTTLYISGKLGAFSERGGSLWKVIVSFLPMFVAAVVAISRFWDHYHRLVDITAGAIIGTVAAFVSYLLYFHSPLSDKSHRPKNRYKFIAEKVKCNGWWFLCCCVRIFIA